MFTLTVQLVHGVYEATSNDAPGEPEWPPHPARLFSGLVAVAEEAVDLAALDWLETLPPPLIGASARVSTAQRSNWVITNELASKKQHMEFSGRSASGKRTWARVVPQSDRITFTWDADPVEHADALDRMARRLPYLGRSTTPVVASFVRHDRAAVDPADVWVPDEEGANEITVPGPGFRASLATAFEANLQPWTVGRSWHRYRSPLDGPPEAVAEAWPSAFEQLIVLGIEGRSKPPYQSVVRYTTAFRSAVIRALDDADLGAGPVELHGHPPDGEQVPRHRVMFVGLPFVGSPHADGHLLGFGVCVPRGMAADDRAMIYRGLVEVDELFGSGLARVRLTRRGRSAQTLQPSRWAGPASVWTTAHPLVLDRHVSSDSEIEPLIRSACRHLDLPEPIGVEWSRDALLEGADRLRSNQLVRRRGERARPAVHARITFAQPVAGPMVLGNMRHLGLGLMLPGPRVAS